MAFTSIFLCPITPCFLKCRRKYRKLKLFARQAPVFVQRVESEFFLNFAAKKLCMHVLYASCILLCFAHYLKRGIIVGMPCWLLFRFVCGWNIMPCWFGNEPTITKQWSCSASNRYMYWVALRHLRTLGYLYIRRCDTCRRLTVGCRHICC